jgi:hypothetical protein
VSVVVHWREASPYGPSLEFVCQVGDMGDARTLARAASAMVEPHKDCRLPASHPLVAVAARHPGELLWRPADSGGEEEWRVGAAGARRFREADVERFTSTQEAARERRHDRRHHHHR